MGKDCLKNLYTNNSMIAVKIKVQNLRFKVKGSKFICGSKFVY